MFKNKRALTLIELLAVIAIIAILFILLIPQISNSTNKAKESGVMIDFKDYERGVKSFLIGDGLLNNNLDKSLRFESPTWFKSMEKNGFGEHYYFWDYNENTVEIATKDDRGKEYRLIISKIDGELVTQTYGFSSDIDSDLNLKRESDNFEYIISGSEKDIVITKYKGTNTALTIPSVIDGFNVTSVGKESFSKRNVSGRSTGATLNSVVIPSSVKTINQFAFMNNNISSIVFNEGLENIKQSAFHTNKISSLSLPNSLLNIEAYSFYNNQIPTVIIPSNVKKISLDVFGANGLGSYKLLGNPVISPDSFPSTANRIY